MSAEKSGRKQRSLKNIIINKSFQYKIIFMVVGIVIMQALMTTSYMLRSFDDFFQSSPAIASGNSDVIEAVEALHMELIVGIGVASLEFFIFALILSLFFSHKMAGPNYAIKRAINNLINGVDHHKIVLRKGDEFHDLAERINTMFDEYHLVPKDAAVPEDQNEVEEE